jgi:hypothetical protein
MLLPALDVAFTPFHPSDPVPPVAVQEVAPLVDHERSVDCPVCTVLGAARKLRTDAAVDGLVAVTLTD